VFNLPLSIIIYVLYTKAVHTSLLANFSKNITTCLIQFAISTVCVLLCFNLS
jgi:hypothetical protein